VNFPPASPAAIPKTAELASARAPQSPRVAAALLLIAAAGVPLSLFWDFSWESTIGIDLFWSLPHAATYLAVGLAGAIALALIITTSQSADARAAAVRLGPVHAPLGVWVSAWGALAFLVAVLFDRWWQSAYGLSAGIWHPPQILKAVAFFAILVGAWLLCVSCQNQFPSSDEPARRNPVLFAASGGVVLTMISVVTLTLIYPNRQHTGTFYKIACGSYPIVLVAVARAGKLRWTAAVSAIVYAAIVCSMVWLLPLFPAKPQVPPIYNPLDHMMPPPFPLLLIAPAIAMDALFRKKFGPEFKGSSWLQAVAAGMVFFALFFAMQWAFGEFLLSDLADNWFFAGGGRHWPFFLKIDAVSRVSFWKLRGQEMNLLSSVIAAGWAVFAARLGLWIGDWMKGVRR
jgi:hypothetical protein